MSEQRIEEARAHHSRGDLARAISTYDEVLAANPDLADVWHLKALAEHQSGRLGEAQAGVARAIAAGGEKPSFLLLEAGVLHDRRDLAAAEERYARVIAARPDWVAGHMGLGSVRMDQGPAAQAIEAYRAAINSAPGHIKARIALAELLAETGHREDARQQYRAIADADPASLMAALGANLVLPQVYASQEHLEESRREYALGLERLHQVAPRFRFSTAEAALKEIRWANFYLAYQGRNDFELQKRFGAFQGRVLAEPAAEFFQPRRARSGGEPIRVGFASHFFFNCTVGRYF